MKSAYTLDLVSRLRLARDRRVVKGSPRSARRRGIRAWQGLERLETRCLLSAALGELDILAADTGDDGPVDAAVLVELQTSALANVQRQIVAGDPNGVPADSPAQRVDPNTTTSAFAGVGSVMISSTMGTYIGSGTAIIPYHVLTAGHCVDLNDDGVIDVSPSNVDFILNAGGSPSDIITAADLDIHPDFDGFNHPMGTVNDDVAVITLSSALPADVPIYPLSADPFIYVETLVLAGYGTSGDGVNGYTVNPSFTVKRSGMNQAEAYISDDEGSGAAEVFEYDFDGPDATTNMIGPDDPFFLTLGNDIETTIGGGDSGGPAFLWDDDGDSTIESAELTLFGVNTFTFSFGLLAPAAPLFGSGGGGIVVAECLDFIDTVINGGTTNTAPVVTVTKPADGTTVEAGKLVRFTGTASDAEDGDLAAGLVWTSSIDGQIGTGARFSTKNLSIGTHVITAAVTDSGGLVGDDVVNIIVTGGDDPGSDLVAPSDLTGSFDGVAVNLSWTDNSDGETGFELQRRLKTPGKPAPFTTIATVGANVTTYQYPDPGAGTWQYRVRAVADGDTSSFSKTLTVRIDGSASSPMLASRLASAMLTMRSQAAASPVGNYSSVSALSTTLLSGFKFSLVDVDDQGDWEAEAGSF